MIDGFEIRMTLTLKAGRGQRFTEPELALGELVRSARATEPPTPWKDLEMRFGATRSELYRIAREAVRGTIEETLLDISISLGRAA